MTFKEFRMWISGFQEAINGAPTKSQWERILEMMERVDDGEGKLAQTGPPLRFTDQPTSLRGMEPDYITNTPTLNIPGYRFKFNLGGGQEPEAVLPLSKPVRVKIGDEYNSDSLRFHPEGTYDK